MNRVVIKSGAVVMMGLVLLSAQGCNTKWLQSDGEGGSGSASSKVPSISGGGSSGELSGFSRNPSEERLAQGGYSTAMNPSGLTARQRAELTKEEKAAVEAGLQDVFFGYDQWGLSEVGMEALNHDAAYLKDHPGAVLKIEGHCDERGTSDYNVVLGDKRAKAARSYLTEAGVSSKQVMIVSYGKERPFCFERDESCYQQNRRGHMLLSTKK
ncbi:MAG: OmpA family protein [Nitrospira sp.]|jgi:peptidoglycan-associated lipoprotein|nr:OmpA family protein [Nitrospira sp. BO4]